MYSPRKQCTSYQKASTTPSSSSLTGPQTGNGPILKVGWQGPNGKTLQNVPIVDRETHFIELIESLSQHLRDNPTSRRVDFDPIEFKSWDKVHDVSSHVNNDQRSVMRAHARVERIRILFHIIQTDSEMVTQAISKHWDGRLHLFYRGIALSYAKMFVGCRDQALGVNWHAKDVKNLKQALGFSFDYIDIDVLAREDHLQQPLPHLWDHWNQLRQYLSAVRR